MASEILTRVAMYKVGDKVRRHQIARYGRRYRRPMKGEYEVVEVTNVTVQFVGYRLRAPDGTIVSATERYLTRA